MPSEAQPRVMRRKTFLFFGWSSPLFFQNYLAYCL